MVATPFSASERRIQIAPLRDGYGYAFDFSNPAGVKLLRPDVFLHLKDLQDRGFSNTNLGSLYPALVKKEKAPQTCLTVWLHVTNQCNFQCHYCYIPNLKRAVRFDEIEAQADRSGKTASIGIKLIRYCEEKGISHLKIVFAGGEPTLQSELI